MKELKTLKDMQDGYLSEDGELISKKTLKAEAVKWVKELILHDDIRNLKRDESIGDWGGYKLAGLEIEAGYEQNDNKGMIKWIKHFFNLTEEDILNG